MSHIIMDEEQTKEIIKRARLMCSKRPYQYKINKKKRSVVEQEGLDRDDEEVEDICATRWIEEILHTTYERKTKGQGSDVEEDSPFQIQISVEPTTPCATKKNEEE